jgi:hypothetical protein
MEKSPPLGQVALGMQHACRYFNGILTVTQDVLAPFNQYYQMVIGSQKILHFRLAQATAPAFHDWKSKVSDDIARNFSIRSCCFLFTPTSRASLDRSALSLSDLSKEPEPPHMHLVDTDGAQR